MKIIQGFPTPQKDLYKVYVHSMTYNHAPYIEDCLNGVAIQETDFPFIHHVIDDASTDGEQNVIKSWMERECDMESAEYYDNDICTITIAKSKKNPNYTLSAYFLKKNMFGNPKKAELTTPWREVCTYTAICEGDDYWIDGNKLQKQVDYLDLHPECTMVRTNINRYFQATGTMEKSFFTGPLCGKIKDTYEDYIMNSWFNGTCTWCYRSGLALKISDIVKELDSQSFKGDALSTLIFCKYGNIHYIPEVTTVYRVLDKSASHIPDKLKAYKLWGRITRLRTYFANEFGLGFRLRFYFKVCKELFMQMAYRRDPKHLGLFIGFCCREFPLLFIKSKRLKLKKI